jgi:hypothetical protein
MSWFSKNSMLITIAVVAVMATIAIIGVLCGVLHHTEGDRLVACWRGDAAYYPVGQGDAFEVDNEKCEEPEEIIYKKKQIPLTVQVFTAENDLSNDQDDIKVAKSIISNYNAQVGFEFYRFIEKGTPAIRFCPDVAYSSKSADGSLQRSSVPGWAAHSKGPSGDIRCSVHVRGGLSIRYAYQVGFHEFGHCAGLSHDHDYPASVMFPLSSDDTLHEKMLPVRLTDNDVELHQIYR